MSLDLPDKELPIRDNIKNLKAELSTEAPDQLASLFEKEIFNIAGGGWTQTYFLRQHDESEQSVLRESLPTSQMKR